MTDATASKIPPNLSKAMDAQEIVPDGGFLSMADVRKPQQVIAPQTMAQAAYQSGAPTTVSIDEARGAVESAFKGGYQEGLVRGAAYAAVTLAGLYGASWIVSTVWSSFSKSGAAVAPK